MIQRKYLILLSLVGALVSFDQLAKLTVLKLIDVGEKRTVLENFLNVSPVNNFGVAFGFMNGAQTGGQSDWILILPLLTVCFLLFLFHRLNDSQMKIVFSISLIVGGALGNIIDRARLGYVVDFIDFHWFSHVHFPAFNIADIAITLGVLVLFASIISDSPSVSSKPEVTN